MKKLAPCIIIAFSFLQIGYSQTNQKLNLDFEQLQNGFPAGWESFGNKSYKIYSDSVTVKNGTRSAVIENNSEVSAFKALAINLPDNYNGKEIRLTGFIKTENVTDGYAGLWMRIDPEVAFDNMSGRGVTGTTDWKEYEITLPLNPPKTDKIVLGGLLAGKGKMWLDNLKVTIDGKDIDDKKMEVFRKQNYAADKDTTFSKGSNIAIPALSSELITNLEILGRIWGFMKYYHPAIAKGNYNWDFELFRILPGYIKVKNDKERNIFLTNWIEKYGEIPHCDKCSLTPGNAVLKPNILWIDSSNLPNTLRSKLHEIYSNRNQEENYYITLQPYVGNPDFKNEKAYANMPYPDDGFRLLSLYKYWNIIEYFYPNKHLTNKKWDIVLKEYIPKFIHSKDELEYELTALELIGEVNDTHANLWGGGNKIAELRGNNFAAFRVQFVENKLVVTDYYNPEFSVVTKLKPGDIITHINGKAVQSIVDSLRPYYPASNEAAMLRDIAADLMRSSQETITLRYISDNQNKEQEVPLFPQKKLNIYGWYKVNKDEKSYKMLNGNIGYITLSNIKEEDVPAIKKSFKTTKGIIIDIRNYPSTSVPFSLGSYFVSNPKPFVEFTQGNIKNPGEFTFVNLLKIPSDKNYYQGKLVVLVNENTQSQAEYTAMAFRAGDNTTIIGSTTAGADGNVSTILLPGGLRTMISGIGIYYPDGKETQRIGIVPDIEIKPTIEGIKKGRDEVLGKAIDFINQ